MSSMRDSNIIFYSRNANGASRTYQVTGGILMFLDDVRPNTWSESVLGLDKMQLRIIVRKLKNNTDGNKTPTK